MKNIVFINAISLSEYSFQKLSTGKTAFSHVLDYAADLEDVKKIIVLTALHESAGVRDTIELFKSGNDAEITLLERDSWNTSALFTAFEDESINSDNFFYIYGDCPFLDPEAAQRIYKNHVQYSAQYSFGDGGPYGILPEIVATEIAGALRVLSDKNYQPVERNTIFNVIQKDINSFDIETDISVVDLRLLRINLTADTRRNYLLIENFLSAGCRSEKDIFAAVEEKPEILRTLPAYFNIQITDRCFQSCSYCPYPLINPDHLSGSSCMSIDKYRTILEDISEFCDDAFISVSLWGEPSAHPDIEELIKQTLKYEKFRLVVETSGTGWDIKVLQSLNLLPQKEKERLYWIISLDSDNEDIYKKLRGGRFSEAFAAAEFLNNSFRENCYYQAVRMNENEEILEQFYKKCKEQKINIIIQKYDNFCSFLPDRKVTDISPLKRLPCWHLKRDMYILLDGTVPLCREDAVPAGTAGAASAAGGSTAGTASAVTSGNVFNSPVRELWKNSEKHYIDHIKGNYKEICRRCDEFYTYNF